MLSHKKCHIQSNLRHVPKHEIPGQKKKNCPAFWLKIRGKQNTWTSVHESHKTQNLYRIG